MATHETQKGCAVVDSSFPEKAITQWQLAQILEDTAKMLKEIPMAAIRRVEIVDYEGVNELAKKIQDSHTFLKAAIKTLDAQEQELYDALEASHKRTKAAWDAHKQRMKAFEEVDPVRLPYNTKELVELADRWAHLSPEKWARVIELAKALSQKDEAN